MASTDARPVPIKNTAFRAVFPILDADGDLVTGATGLDSEVSKDQGTFADCTNEATEIATSSGMYYLDLTSTEMNADCVAVIVKTSSSGAKTTVLVFYPVEAGDIDVDVTAWNGTAVSSPATAGIPEVNVKNINNVSASSVTTVNANQGTTQPINFTGTGASALAKGDMVDVAGAAVSTSSAQIGVNVVNAGGTAWGSGAITAASIATDAITSAKIASGAITSTGIAASAIGASQLASGAITNAKFAAGAIDAAAIAADAIGASELAADAATEIGTAVWATAARTLTAATNITSTGGTTVPQTGDSYARLGAPAGASVSADVAAVKTDTGNILTKLLKYVQLLVRKDAAIATDNATELTAINANGGSGAGSFDNTTDSEQALRDRGDAAWITATGFSTLDAAGVRTAVGLASANLDTQLTAIDDYIDTEVAAIKAKTDLIPASPAATSDIPSAATIADAVWDEALSGHTTAGSGGKALGDIDTHTDTETGAAAIRAAVGLASANLDTQLAAVQADTDDIQTRLPAALVSGRIDASVGAMAANVVTASAIATDAIGASELAADAVAEIGTAVWATAARTLTAATNITSTGGTTVPQTGDSYARLGAPAGASVSADVAAVKTDTGNILTKLLKYVQLMVRKDSAIATDNATELTAINANGGSGAGSFDNTTDSEQAIRDNMTTPPTAAAIADQVWEEAIADHSGTTGSTAEALNSAGSAGDPWTTALPGAYGAGSAGKIIGDNINATISSRASQASVDTIDDYIDTEVAAIKAKTDQLTFTTAGQVDATTMSVANNALTAAAAAADLGTEIATAVWASATRTLSALGFTLGASDLAADTITAAKIATDAIGSDELATSAVTEIVNAVLTTAMTESYNADGAAPTLAQALFMTMQRLTEFAISGTTVTVKKLDGSTTAYTLTLDDATDPTSTTRAT